MALFFTLSGFLITRFLASGAPLGTFVAKRIARILPLAWAAMIVLCIWHVPDAWTVARNFSFTANLPPAKLLEGGEHLWSLCLEMQFYIGIAIICMTFGRRGLYVVPLISALVTFAKIWAGETISIVTWHRVDEILAGSVLALTYGGWFGARAAQFLRALPMWPFVIAAIAASHPALGGFQYLRPYAACLLVGATLTGAPSMVHSFLVSRPMRYVAEISYALYVVHGVLIATWLGSGDRTARYLKRPLLFAGTFALAHVSTRYFEQPITRWVRDATRGKSA
jgi:peptidoglycan/LPS O-acetylase OafA/YrhL